MPKEVEVVDCARVLEKTYIEDNDQNKDQGQEEHQIKIEDTQAEEENVEHQDLPKSRG